MNGFKTLAKQVVEQVVGVAKSATEINDVWFYENIYLRHLLYWVLGSLLPSILLSFLLPDLLSTTTIFCVFFGLYLYCFGVIAYKFRGAYNDTLRIIAFIPLLNAIVIQFIVPKDTQTPTHAFLICFLQGTILLILNTLLFVPSIFYARYIVNRNKR